MCVVLTKQKKKKERKEKKKQMDADKKKEEALKLGMAMAKRASVRDTSGGAAPVALTESRTSGVQQKSPRTSHRGSMFEGLAAGGSGDAEKISVAESALSRGFRLIADLFDDEKKTSVSAKRDALAKYADSIDVQESNLKGVKDPKAAKLVAEHREIHQGYIDLLEEAK